MYERIVVGTDGSSTSRAAVDHAREVAVSTGAALHLVTAVRLPSRAAAMTPELAGVLAVSDADAERAAEQLLADLADDVRRHGVTDVRTHVCHSAPADALCTIAAAEHADLLVVGNRGMKGARRALGSVPNKVAHHADCAVLIVPTC